MAASPAESKRCRGGRAPMIPHQALILWRNAHSGLWHTFTLNGSAALRPLPEAKRKCSERDSLDGDASLGCRRVLANASTVPASFGRRRRRSARTAPCRLAKPVACADRTHVRRAASPQGGPGRRHRPTCRAASAYIRTLFLATCG